MKTVKRVVILITCFFVLLSSFSVGAAAEYDPYTGFEFDFDTDMYYDPYTGQEMIYDEAGDYFYAVHEPLEYEPFELFRLSSPNFKDIDISKLPWLEMPTYVQDILYSTPEGLTKTSEVDYTGNYKLPFVMLICGGSYVTVYAGYNLCIGAYLSSSSLGVSNYGLISIKAHKKIYENSVCYYATYNTSDYSLRNSWSTVEPVAVGDSYVRYTSLNYTSSAFDYYFYGSSGMYAGRTYQSQKIDSTDTDTYPQYRVVNDPTSGFASGTIMYMPDNWSSYIGTFTPPTAEQQQASTSKGIWESIKELPSKVADSIKGFFTTLGEYVNALPEKIKVFFTSLGDRISGFFTDLKNGISGFFTSLGDRISGFFITLRNYLLYFSSERPEHENPFDDITESLSDFFNEKVDDFNSFNDSLNESLDNIVDYISVGSSFINSFLEVSSLLSAFITFFVAFFIVRKVVGR